MKTAVSLPDPLFVRVDKYAFEHNLSRSALFAVALTEYMEHHKKEGLVQQINDVLTEIVGKSSDESSDETRALLKKSAQVLLENEW